MYNGFGYIWCELRAQDRFERRLQLSRRVLLKFAQADECQSIIYFRAQQLMNIIFSAVNGKFYLYPLSYYLMLTRKNIVITGANSGIGFETVRGLYADGHNLIFGSRSEEKNREALQLIMKDNTKSIGTVKCFKLDLSKQSSIEQFVRQVQKQFTVIDMLINNAGLIMNDRVLNEKNIEMMMAINHFGHFYLTYLLLPRIKTATEARIINVSSVAHKLTKLSTSEDLSCEHDFGSFSQYSRSKLANVQFTVALAEKLSRYPNIKAMSLHPGSVDTGFGSEFSCLSCLKVLFCCCFKNSENGARTSLYLSRIPFQELRNGEYYDSDTSIVEMNPLGNDKRAVDGLWAVSEKAFGIEFKI